ncbi:MAG TPA: hypothetical protein VLS49_14745 [Usitatibacter sp.]|nr:hypothetical protein [Usitatibacter sp.]
MPATWLATLKTVVPYIEPLVSLVTPVFTKKRADSIAAEVEILQRQVEELQQAAARDTGHIRELAEQLKRVVVALDQAAVNLEAANRRHWTLGIVAICVSAAALAAVAALALFR